MGNVELEKEHTVSLPKRKETAKTETIQKNVFFQMTGKYVKGEVKEGTKKRIIKSKRIIKKNIQEREQKMRMSKKQTRINTKKENIFLVKGIEKKQTCKKAYKFVKMSNGKK